MSGLKAPSSVAASLWNYTPTELMVRNVRVALCFSISPADVTAREHIVSDVRVL